MAERVVIEKYHSITGRQVMLLHSRGAWMDHGLAKLRQAIGVDELHMRVRVDRIGIVWRGKAKFGKNCDTQSSGEIEHFSIGREYRL